MKKRPEFIPDPPIEFIPDPPTEIPPDNGIDPSIIAFIFQEMITDLKIEIEEDDHD